MKYEIQFAGFKVTLIVETGNYAAVQKRLLTVDTRSDRWQEAVRGKVWFASLAGGTMC